MMPHPTALVLALAWVVLGCAASTASAAEPDLAKLLATTPASGIVGLVEPSDLTLAQAITAKQGWTIHAVVKTAATRDALVAQAAAAGISGRFSASLWSGTKLPFAPHLLNVLVLGKDAAAVAQAERERVTAPLGIIASEAASGWTYTPTTVASAMDVWPQWRHDAGRTRSSKDSLVRGCDVLHWQAGLAHDEMPFLTADGVLLTQQPGSANKDNQPYVIKAYNAFNGTALWQTTLNLSNTDTRWGITADWMWGERVGFSGSIVNGKLLLPANPIAVLELHSGVALPPLKTASPVARAWVAGPHLVLVGLDAVSVHDAGSLAQKWSKPMKAYDLACAGSTSFAYLDISKTPCDLVACTLDSGKELWRTSMAPWWVEGYEPKLSNFNAKGKTFIPVRIVMSTADKLLVRSSRDRGHLLCLDPATGKTLWQWDQQAGIPTIASLPPLKFKNPKEPQVPADIPMLAGADTIVLAGDRLWFPLGLNCSDRRIGIILATGTIAAQTQGQVVNDFCQLAFGTATMACFKDVCWADATTGKTLISAWSPPVGNNRCVFHTIPAYGVSYFGPKACQCSAVGNGVRAAMDLAQTGDAFLLAAKPTPEHVMETGSGKPGTASSDGWPTFMGDGRRMGTSTISPPKAPSQRWQQAVAKPKASQWLSDAGHGDALTQVVTSGDIAVVAEVDTGTVIAVEQQTGKPRWTRTLPGRVWAAPTLHAGLCVVGADDGWVSALSLADGAVVWRSRAAPSDRLVALHGRMASAWPVRESVLATNGVLVAVAGVLDSDAAGSWAVAMDPLTGKVKWSSRWRKGLPTLNSDGLMYVQTNSQKVTPFGIPCLNANDGSAVKGGGGFRMEFQSSQPTVSRQLQNLALAPAVANSDRLFARVDQDRGQCALVCVPIGANASNGKLSGMYGTKVSDLQKEATWRKAESEIGIVRALIVTPAGLLVASAPAQAPGKGTLRLLKLADGSNVWEVELGGPVVHQGLALDAAGITAALADGRLTRLAW